MEIIEGGRRKLKNRDDWHEVALDSALPDLDDSSYSPTRDKNKDYRKKEGLTCWTVAKKR